MAAACGSWPRTLGDREGNFRPLVALPSMVPAMFWWLPKTTTKFGPLALIAKPSMTAGFRGFSQRPLGKTRVSGFPQMVSYSWADGRIAVSKYNNSIEIYGGSALPVTIGSLGAEIGGMAFDYVGAGGHSLLYVATTDGRILRYDAVTGTPYGAGGNTADYRRGKRPRRERCHALYPRRNRQLSGVSPRRAFIYFAPQSNHHPKSHGRRRL